MDVAKWKDITVKDLEPNPHNKPICLHYSSVPKSWAYKTIVVARALTNTKIGLALEEFDKMWGARPIDWWYKVPVWIDHGTGKWWVQLHDQLYQWYELIQPEVKVGILPAGTEGLLLIIERESLIGQG